MDTDAKLVPAPDPRFGEDRPRFVVRAAEPGDLPRVQALAARLLEGMPAWRQTPETLRAASGWLADALAPAPPGGVARTAYVAEADGEVVGVVGVADIDHFSGVRQAYLGELAVAAGWDGRGVGRALVAAAESWAAARGLAEVSLATGAANGRARRFYAMLGFEEDSVGLVKRLGQPAAGRGEGD